MSIELDDLCNETERCFNIAGSIPLVGIISGGIRASAAQIQATAGLIFACIGLAGTFLSSEKKWGNITVLGTEHLIQGCLNTLRGVGEFFVGCTIIGSAVLGAWQYGSANKFNPIVPYRSGHAFQT